MNGNTIIIILLGSIVSLLGTMIGASLGILVKNPSDRLLGAVIGFAGGLMLAVVVFQLIPESMEKWSFGGTLISCLAGIVTIIFIDRACAWIHITGSKHKKVAFMVALGLMLHNLPEGVIMGCGFLAGSNLGIKMSFIIAIHDIPEGIAVSAPLMASKVNTSTILLYTLITALPTALGAFIGINIGGISTEVLGGSLAFASGVMLYVVCGEMIPESSKLWGGITSTMGTLSGFILGFVMTNIL